MLFFTGIYLQNRTQINQPSVLSEKIFHAVPTFTPTPIPQWIFIPTPTPDPDPIITCKFKYISPMQLRKSVCSASTECEIDGKWYFYESVTKCKEDQNHYFAIWQANNPIPPPIFIPPPPPIDTNTFNTSNATQQMQAIGNAPIITSPIDGSITVVENPQNTPIVPYGFGNY